LAILAPKPWLFVLKFIHGFRLSCREPIRRPGAFCEPGGAPAIPGVIFDRAALRLLRPGDRILRRYEASRPSPAPGPRARQLFCASGQRASASAQHRAWTNPPLFYGPFRSSAFWAIWWSSVDISAFSGHFAQRCDQFRQPEWRVENGAAVPVKRQRPFDELVPIA